MDLAQVLASDVFQLPVSPEPIRDRAQSFRDLADALDVHGQSLLNAHDAAVAAGNTSQAMAAAETYTHQHAQALADAAADARANASRLDLVEAGAALLTALIVWYWSRIALTNALNPAAAPVEAMTAAAEISATRKKILTRLTEWARNQVERDGNRMHKKEKGKKKVSRRTRKVQKDFQRNNETSAAISDVAGKYPEVTNPKIEKLRSQLNEHAEHFDKQGQKDGNWLMRRRNRRREDE